MADVPNQEVIDISKFTHDPNVSENLHIPSRIDMSAGVTVTTVANVLFAIVIGIAIIWYNQSAFAAIITAGLYYGIFNSGALALMTGTVTDIIVNWQIQVTERQRNQLHYKVERPTRPALVEAPRTPAALPHGPTFVPVAEPEVIREAILWAFTLYLETGEVDPKKVHLNTEREVPGRLRIAAPTGAVREYLLKESVLQKVNNGFRLNINRFPSIDHVRAIYNF